MIHSPQSSVCFFFFFWFGLKDSLAAQAKLKSKEEFVWGLGGRRKPSSDVPYAVPLHSTPIAWYGHCSSSSPIVEHHMHRSMQQTIFPT